MCTSYIKKKKKEYTSIKDVTNKAEGQSTINSDYFVVKAGQDYVLTSGHLMLGGDSVQPSPHSGLR